MKTMLAALLIVLVAPLARAHEVWLDPVAYVADPGEVIKADLRNGEEFRGSAYPFNRRTFVRFDWRLGEETAALEGRLGDTPAVSLIVPEPGLLTLIYQSTSRSLVYRKWEKFAAFAAHKDFADIEARHDARALPREGFREAYSRFAKALVAVGNGAGADEPAGLETELVALDNPYTMPGETVRVRALYKDAPRADAQIELFEEAPDGTVLVTLHRTDADGVAALPVRRGYEYLVDAVVLREPEPDLGPRAGSVWETLWAALTFAVPEAE